MASKLCVAFLAHLIAQFRPQSISKLFKLNVFFSLPAPERCTDLGESILSLSHPFIICFFIFLQTSSSSFPWILFHLPALSVCIFSVSSFLLYFLMFLCLDIYIYSYFRNPNRIFLSMYLVYTLVTEFDARIYLTNAYKA